MLARKRHLLANIGSNRAPHSYMSIFSLDKGEKEHAVFVNANRGWGCLNSYFQTGNYSGPMFDMDRIVVLARKRHSLANIGSNRAQNS